MNPARQAAEARSRARALGCEASLTADEWLAVLEHYRWRCAYGCAAPRPGKHERLVLHHVLPLEQGGPAAVGNVVPACRRCQSALSTPDHDPDQVPGGLEGALAAARSRPLRAEDRVHGWQDFAAACGSKSGRLTTNRRARNCDACIARDP